MTSTSKITQSTCGDTVPAIKQPRPNIVVLEALESVRAINGQELCVHLTPAGSPGKRHRMRGREE